MESKILKKLRLPFEKNFFDKIYHYYFDGDMLLDIYKKTIQNFVSENMNDIFFQYFKVTKKTAPKLHKIFNEVLDKLELDNSDIEFYLTSSQEINAYAITTNKFLKGEPPAIVLNAGLIKTLNDDELKHVIGHEIGHIIYNHSVLRFICFDLLRIFDKKNELRLLKFINFFQHWEQLSEISADRVGLFSVENSVSAITSLIKLSHGLPEDILKIDAEEVLSEIDNFFEKNNSFYLPSSHPALVIRIKLLDIQSKSNFFKKLQDKDYEIDDDSLDVMVKFLDSMLKKPSTEMLKIENAFLEIFGLLTMLSDGEIKKEELLYLMGLLSFTNQFPELPSKEELFSENFEGILKNLLNIIKINYPERKEILFNALVRLTLSDNEFNREEYNFLKNVGRDLEIPEQTIAQIILDNISENYIPLK